jgi:hypothetical protein
MKAVFEIFDSRGDGMVQVAEVGAVLRRLNLVKSRKLIQTIIDIVDTDGDGAISFASRLGSRVVGVAERKVAQHLKECVVALGNANVLNVIGSHTPTPPPDHRHQSPRDTPWYYALHAAFQGLLRDPPPISSRASACHLCRVWLRFQEHGIFSPPGGAGWSGEAIRTLSIQPLNRGARRQARERTSAWW